MCLRSMLIVYLCLMCYLCKACNKRKPFGTGVAQLSQQRCSGYYLNALCRQELVQKAAFVEQTLLLRIDLHVSLLRPSVDVLQENV